MISSKMLKTCEILISSDILLKREEEGLKLTLAKCQMQVKISVGEYIKLCQSPGGR